MFTQYIYYHEWLPDARGVQMLVKTQSQVINCTERIATSQVLLLRSDLYILDVYRKERLQMFVELTCK